jgi:tetratricopeptide (TPR) repeat protein/predicted membrane-bound spermidine synthase
MVLELVAGRLIARFLGASLYTWTSVIGVVLAGITLGNYLGGRIADRFSSRKALALLFALASVACVATVALNNIIALWTWLWQFSWPLRVFSHVSLVFLAPSVILGTISPVVAKMALDQGLATGRTVGDIYAWGAAGSIVGTFAAGYYLIATMGSVAIIWTVALVLLAMAILYWSRLKILYVWALLLAPAMTMGLAPWPWAQRAGAALSFRPRPDSAIIYETESQYSYIQVRRMSQKPEKRHFVQDKLVHSAINIDDTSDLQYHYSQVWAAITRRFSRGKDHPSFLIMGGGGYVFPGYLEKSWPASRIDVAEIDPAVTEAAMKIFWPRENSSIRTIAMDARNYIDGLLEQHRTGGEKVTYDFIYEDAINNFSVPYQLTTRQFNDKFSKVLTEDGIYMVNLIDNYDSGLFVGSFVNTLELTFPYVYVISDPDEKARQVRQTFVIIASRRSLDLDNLDAEYKEGTSIWLLNEAELEQLKGKSRGLVLTDDYAPVENLLAPVVRKEATEALAKRKEIIARQENIPKARKIAAEIEELAVQNKADEVFEKLRNLEPALASYCVQILASNLAVRAKSPDGKTYKAAAGLADLYYDLGIKLTKLGKKPEGMLQLRLAEQAYRQQLAINPNSEQAHSHLGGILFLLGGDSAQIVRHFQRAAELNPLAAQNQFNLIMALEAAGKIDQAIIAAQKAIKLMQDNAQDQAAKQLQQYLQRLNSKKMQSRQPLPKR